MSALIADKLPTALPAETYCVTPKKIANREQNVRKLIMIPFPKVKLSVQRKVLHLFYQS